MICVPDNANPFSFIILILSTDEVGFVIPIMHKKLRFRLRNMAKITEQTVQFFKDSKDFNPLKKWFYDEVAPNSLPH